MFTSSEIAKQFTQFYTKLYNLPIPDTPDNMVDRGSMISEFLHSYSPNPITADEADELDRPIEKEEAVTALEQL